MQQPPRPPRQAIHYSLFTIHYSLISVVGGAGQEGVNSVDLFEQDNEGEFVLHGVATKAEDVIAGGAKSRGVTISSADEEGDVFDGLELPAADLGFEFAGGPVEAAFVHGDAEAALAGFEKAGRNRFRIAGLDVADINFAERAEAVFKEFHGIASVGDGGSGSGDNAEVHVSHHGT